MYTLSELQGKSLNQLLKIKRQIRREIKLYQTEIENAINAYKDDVDINNLHNLIEQHRSCLETVVNILKERQFDNIFTQEELKQLHFDELIPNISAIIVDVSSMLPSSTYIFNMEDNHIKFISLEFGNINAEPTILPITVPELYNKLKEFHIGEWRQRYSCEDYGHFVCDGEQWELEIAFKDGKTKKWKGYNAYPYNFYKLMAFLGLYEEDDDSESDS